MNTLQKSLLIATAACSVIGTTLPMEDTQESTTLTVEKKEATKKILLKTLKSLAQDLDHHGGRNCEKDLCNNYSSDSDSYDGDSRSILDKMATLLRMAKKHDITFTDEDLQPLTFARKTHVWKKKPNLNSDSTSHAVYGNTKNFWPVHCAIETIHKNLLDELLQHDITCNKKKGKRKITPCEQILKELKRSNDRSLSNFEDRSNFENRINILFRLEDFPNFADELNNHDSNSDSDWTENFDTSYRLPGVESSSDSESDTSNYDFNSLDQPKLEEKDGQ